MIESAGLKLIFQDGAQACSLRSLAFGHMVLPSLRMEILRERLIWGEKEILSSFGHVLPGFWSVFMWQRPPFLYSPEYPQILLYARVTRIPCMCYIIYCKVVPCRLLTLLLIVTH